MKYISVDNMVRFINDIGIETILTEFADYLKTDYQKWDQFEKSPRYANHTPQGVIELMPTSDDTYFGFKYVNGHPANFKNNLQTVVAFGVLSDLQSGYPLLLSEMTLGTALRTAANSALVAKYLANDNAKTLTLIGNGCQAEFQSHAFKAICGIENLRLYDIDPEVSKKFIKNMKDENFDITLCKSAQEAVEGADIITTCTADKQKATILTDNMVGQGMHINAIGGDCPGKTELHPDILHRGPVFVEYEPQTRIEGDIQQMGADFPVTEIHTVFSSDKPFRQSAMDVTIFDGVGFALQDFSFLRYMHDKTKETDYFEDLKIIGELEDQRNLYGLLKA